MASGDGSDRASLCKAGSKAMMLHPLQAGQIFHSPGGTCTYQVIGAVCLLYDRELLPWPCCRLSWRGKEPSWRRIGRRFVPDIAAKNSPSYVVKLIDYPNAEPVVKTLFWVKLEPDQQQWCYSKRLRAVSADEAQSIFRLGEAQKAEGAIAHTVIANAQLLTRKIVLVFSSL